jgi:hypothetical protein
MRPPARRFAGAAAFGILYAIVASFRPGERAVASWTIWPLLFGVFLGYLVWPRVEIAVRRDSARHLTGGRLVGTVIAASLCTFVFFLVARLADHRPVDPVSLIPLFLFIMAMAYLAWPGIDRELGRHQRR